MKIVTAQEMKSLDERAVRDGHIPSLLLMENAARGLVDRLEAVLGPVASRRGVVLCGRGNNGGDGLAAARHLRMRGAHATVYLLSPPEKIEGDARVSLEIWIRTCGALHVVEAPDDPSLIAALQHADFILDALLGTGLRHPVVGRYAEVIARVNAIRRVDCPVVSVDIPSGISADTGEALGAAIRADHTIAMALPKRGHFAGAGLECRGRLSVVDIGIPPAFVAQAGIGVEMIVPARCRLPARAPGTHKGMMGHLLLIAGSVGKGGAVTLAGEAALRSGCGLVTAAMPKSLHVSNPTEMMTLALVETDEGTLAQAAVPALRDAATGKSAVALGPGLGTHHAMREWLPGLIAEITLPMVVDADGLNVLALDRSVLKKRHAPTLLTPHPKEMARLLGTSSESVQRDRFAAAGHFAKEWGVIVVLKGAHTLVAAPDGTIWVNDTGNPGMATAGTGDALTGVIGSLLAQGIDPLLAAIWGVYFHGRAGDLAARDVGEAGLIASDLIARIPDAIGISRHSDPAAPGWVGEMQNAGRAQSV